MADKLKKGRDRDIQSIQTINILASKMALPPLLFLGIFWFFLIAVPYN